MNEAIQRFVDELAADPAVRGIILFGSHARGNARADSDADLVILGERDQFEMGFTERDGQKFELLRWSEAVAIRYAIDNRDRAADFWQVAQILYDPDGAAARLRDQSHRADRDVLRCARRVDAPDEAPPGADRRPRSGSCTACSPRSTRTARCSRTSCLRTQGGVTWR